MTDATGGEPEPFAQRRTLAAPATVQGTGLFTGEPGSVTFEPARAGAGLRVRDSGSAESVLAHVGVLDQSVAHPAFESMPARNTTLGVPMGDGPGRSVFTAEHALSALVGLGITDAVLAIDGPEIPILDGSAAPFVEAILHAGLATPAGSPGDDPGPLRVDERVQVEDGRGGRVTIEPAEQAEYRYRLDFGPAAPIRRAEAAWDGRPEAYAASVAPARTFCLEPEARQMHAMGLFAALTPRDMLVIGPDGPIDNQYRFPDEPARHKLLDLIGDMALVGRPLVARVIADRSGHALHHAAAKALLQKT